MSADMVHKQGEMTNEEKVCDEEGVRGCTNQEQVRKEELDMTKAGKSRLYVI